MLPPSLLWPTVALMSSAVAAFHDSSLFMAFPVGQSTAGFNDLASNTLSSPIRASELLAEVIPQSSTDCSADAYVLVNQPGATADDFLDGENAPHLARHVAAAGNNNLMSADTVGSFDLERSTAMIRDTCGAVVNVVDVNKNGQVKALNQFPQVVRLDFPALPARKVARKEALLEHDSILNALLSSLSSPDRSSTVIYTTTPPPHRGASHSKGTSSHASHHAHAPHRQPAHEDPQHPLHSLEFADLDSTDPVHARMKRDLASHSHAARQSDAPGRDVGLFEEYNFLSPGVFMGGVATLILGSILYVGMLAVSSIEIPVMAFSKEMGPAAQRAKAQ